MKQILLGLKRYIFSPLFAVAVIAALALMIYPIFGNLTRIFDHPQPYLYYINGIHTFGTFDLFAPAIAAIPCGAAFYNDYGSGFCKFILPRTSKIKYLLAKAFTCGITGGLALFLPNFLLFGFILLFGNPHSSELNLLQGSVLGSIEHANNGVNVMLVLLLLAFLFGAGWALVGLAVSAFIPNKFAAAASPFMIYFALSTALSLDDNCFIFSPMNMLYPNALAIPSITFCVIYLLVLIVVSAAIFILRAYRRLKNAL